MTHPKVAVGAVLICCRCSETVPRNSNVQKLCSDCSRIQKFEGIRDRKRRLRYRMQEVRGPVSFGKICVRCEKDYSAGSLNRKYCDECDFIVKRERSKERTRVYRQKPETAITEKKWRYSESGRLSLYLADQRRKSTVKGKLEGSIRNGITRGLRFGSKNGRSTFSLLGYSLEELRFHLETQFKEGMSWDNYGDWHIDHKVPLSVFNYSTPDDLDFKRAWALSNLRPLWSKENIAKNNRISEPFQPSFAWS